MAQEKARYIRQWYAASREDEDCLQPAREAFLEALSVFKAELTKDPQKATHGVSYTSLTDVENAVKDAQKQYEDHRKDGKARDRLKRFSQVVHYYGNVIEVFFQHHPEYVALAWGAMKSVFITFLNHEATVSALAQGLSQVATVLPRTELSLVLYPTERMKRAIAQLYAHIIRFLIRAKEWYDENKLKHLWHSISRPVELRFNGLISDIESLSATVDNLAMHGSRAELRDVHQKIEQGSNELAALQKEVMETKELIVSLKSFVAGAFVNTNSLLTDIQVSNIVQSLPNNDIPNPEISYQYNLMMRNRRLKQGIAPDKYPVLTPALRSWSHAPGPSLLLLPAAKTLRKQMRDLAVSLVDLIRQAKAPVLWALDSNAGGTTNSKLDSAVAVLRRLAEQAIALGLAHQTEATASMLHARFSRANKVEDMIHLLATCMRNIPVVYIVIDVDPEDIDAAERGLSLLTLAFFRLLQSPAENAPQLKMRVFMTVNEGAGDTIQQGGDTICQVQTIRSFNLGRQQPKGFRQRGVLNRRRGNLNGRR
ncbi:hypothetical protein TARUN_9255 [Trichoderma arundinaceum]|uniref:DUF7708 domain-containing protein n=1 Tax=Trichoderma arundinaceum TaxID=490622 RepID=A0A395NAZ4_TRIAR|nr:hypothetical protein TARUN_9255 [Trichoderma arundinaceum]